MARVWLSIPLSCLIACAANTDAAREVCGTGAELVTQNRLAGNKLAANRLAANRLAANRLAGNKLATNKLAGNRLAGNRLAGNRLAGNRLAGNRLAGNKIARNKLATNKLATNGLSSLRLELDESAAAELMATEDGREVLKFTIECALPADTTIVSTHDGSTYEFDGALGLAPQWLEEPLDTTGQRWVSACLLARVNAHGVTVRVSLRGPLGALETTDSEMATWDLEEGAFWGDVFGAADEPLDWNACRGVGQAAGETGDLADRDCTEPDAEHPGFTLCGFKYAGDCSDVCGQYESEGMYYASCAGADAADDARFQEVVTTFAALSASCD